jgi:hypothetical protein
MVMFVEEAQGRQKQCEKFCKDYESEAIPAILTVLEAGATTNDLLLLHLERLLGRSPAFSREIPS